MAGSYNFDGTDDKIVYTDAAAMDALNLSEYLIQVWVRPGAGGANNGRIFGRAATGSGGPVGHMQVMVGNGGNGTRNEEFTTRQKTTANAGTLVSATGQIPNTTWSLISGHYDDTGGGDSRWRIYADGAADTGTVWLTASGTIDDESDQDVTVGNSFFGDRAYQGQIVYIGIWDVSSLTTGQIDTLVTDFYNSGTGTADVPQQDLLVEFLRLDADGVTTGDLGVLTSPTVTGAAFTSSNAPPVDYNALAGDGGPSQRFMWSP